MNRRRRRRSAAGSEANAALPEPLTGRELQVLQLVAEGRRNRDVANALVMAVKTVESHVRHVMQKLGARNRTEAVIRAERLGLITPMNGGNGSPPTPHRPHGHTSAA